ncbi:hypothetical protein ABEW61_09110 [Paenibacillus amylolyticus]|uniref:hypothetical protein n=1 Tax=Paenibacillus TaxID=44249 RepID=UPI000C270ADC|nr:MULTISPECIES: hypothetical protein [Paenibacillus]PJN58610.1 hypothetical protein PAEAM_32600 [Paenibacillus sp. GM1FR]
MAEAVCTTYGASHRMYLQGAAYVADSTGKLLTKQFPGHSGFFKCKCGDRFVAEGAPESGAVIGNYVTQGGILAAESKQGVAAVKVNTSMIRNTTARTLSGFTFYNSNPN